MNTLNSTEIKELADAYFRGLRDPVKWGAILAVARKVREIDERKAK